MKIIYRQVVMFALQAILSSGILFEGDRFLGKHLGGVPLVACSIIWTYLSTQVHIAIFRLSHAPLYPRERISLNSAVAPEPESKYRSASSDLVLHCVIFIACLAALMMFEINDRFLPTGTLSALLGTLIGWKLTASKLDKPASERIEARLSGRYTLYLRNFQHARPLLTLASILACRDQALVIVLSPDRHEARKLVWYLIAVASPQVFWQINFWETSDLEWHRVVLYCMVSANRIIIDCSSANWTLEGGGTSSGSGLTWEILSAAAQAKMGIAYLSSTRLPEMIPEPCILHLGTSALSVLRTFRNIVIRIRKVINHDLSNEELKHIKEKQEWFAEIWRDAMIRDKF